MGTVAQSDINYTYFQWDNKNGGSSDVGVTSDLPTKLENGKLIFKNTAQDCDKKMMTYADLKNGLPKSFLRKCKGKCGDIYHFYDN